MKSILKKMVVAALTWEARLALLRHKPKVVAITGNVGKTSTKDAVYAVMAKAFRTRKSEKSQNSEIGVPLTVLGLENAWGSASGWMKNLALGLREALFSKNYPQWLVLEVGADHPGDIERITAWLKPDIVTLTRMSLTPVHVENFPDARAVLREKMFLAQALKPGGILVVNSDDLLFGQAVKDIAADKIFYGASDAALPRIKNVSVSYDAKDSRLPVGMKAEIDLGGRIAHVDLPGVIGEHLVYPVAAACGVARALHVEGTIPEAFEGFEPPKGRMRLLRGKEGSTVLDDSYNSSPLACAEAIRALSGLSVRGRKIAALGDMKELGKDAERAHREIGKLAGENLHMLVAVGELSRSIAEAALEAGMPRDMVFTYSSSEDAGKILADMVRAGDAVLVKGSQSMRMERVSKAILEDQAKATDLLVRQEREWIARR